MERLEMIKNVLAKAKKCGLENIMQSLMMGLDSDYHFISGGIWTNDTEIPFVRMDGHDYLVRENVSNLFMFGENIGGFSSSGLPYKVSMSKNVVLYSLTTDTMYIVVKLGGEECVYAVAKEPILAKDANMNSGFLGAGYCPTGDSFENPVHLMYEAYMQVGKFVTEGDRIVYYNRDGKEIPIKEISK